MKYRIAHISDLHYGDDEAHNISVRRALEGVAAAAADHVVITGDLTERGQPEELLAIRELLEDTGVAVDGRLTLIPGNHDLFGFFFRHFQSGKNLVTRLPKVPKIAAQSYRFGIAEYMSALESFRYFFHRWSPPIPGCIRLGQQISLAVVESNYLPNLSNNLSCSLGQIDTESLRTVLGGEEDHRSYRILVTHHHFEPLDRVASDFGRTSAKAMRLVNRQEVIEIIEGSQVKLVLHGHYHRSEDYCVPGCSARFVNSGDFRRWHLIEIDDDGISVRIQESGAQ